MAESLLDYAPVDNTTSDNLADYTSIDNIVKKPKSYLERTREFLSPLVGPTAQQIAEQPPQQSTPYKIPEISNFQKRAEQIASLPAMGIPYTSQDAVDYVNRVKDAQGLLPKLFTSPYNLPVLPQATSTSGQIGSGLYNAVVKGGVESLLSPGGLATLGVGAAAKGGSVLANLAGKALGGVLAPQAVGQIIEGYNAPTLQQKIEGLVGGGLLGLSSIAGMRGVGPKILPKETIRPTETLVGKTSVEPISALLEDYPKAKQIYSPEEVSAWSDKEFPTGILKDYEPIEVKSTTIVEPTKEVTPTVETIKPEDKLTEYIPSNKEEVIKPTTESEVSNATKPISTNIGEHQGVSTGENIPTNVEKIRQSEGTKTSDSSGLQHEGGEQGLSKSEGGLTPEQGGYREDEPYTVKRAGGKNIGKWEIPYIGQFLDKNEADIIASKLNESKVSPKLAYEAARKGVPEVLKLTEKPIGGLDIKINPNTGELGGIDISAVMNFARSTYDNIKEFGAWSKEMLSKFPQLGEHIKRIWNQLRAGHTDAPLTESAITKLSNTGGPKGEVLADRANEAYNLYRENKGKYIETPIRELKTLLPNKSPKDILQNNNESARRVLQYMDEVNDNGTSNIKLSPDEYKAVDIIKRTNLGVRADQNSRPGLRTGGVNPDYLQQSFSRNALHYITNEPESPQARQYEKDFIKYRTDPHRGQSLAEAQADWNIIRSGFSKQTSDAATQFGPIDKAAGLGIPPSMRSNNLFERIKNYGDRVSRRFAYHDAIEASPEAQDALTLYKANENWKRIFRDLSGQREIAETKRNAIAGLAKAGITGTYTGVRNLIQGQYLGWDQMTSRQILINTIKAWGDFKTNWDKTFKLGINRENFASIEFGEGGLKDSIRTINRIRDISNEAMGKNVLEKTARTVNFGLGRLNTVENFNAAVNGTANKTQLRWLDNYGKRENWKQYIKAGKLPEEVIDRMSALFTESLQGTYDLRTLPSWAIEGSLAPLVSLSRWSIDRTNRFTRNVITPLVNGDITPALKATLGMVVGASVIDELNKLITKRRSPVPTIFEIDATQDQEADITHAVIYKLASLSSMSSIAGFYGDLFKSLMDKTYGNRVQGINNPALELVENLYNRTYDVMEAFSQGELHWSEVPNIISKYLEDNMQNWRIAMANFSADKQQEIERANAFKERRIFRQLTNRPVSELSGEDTSNPFIGGAIREYKRTSDINRAVELMPRIGEEVLTKSKNDPETLMRTLRGLKNNSYTTFPDIERDPLEFYKYLRYLQQSKGPEETQRMLEDYYKQKKVNEAKSRFIP